MHPDDLKVLWFCRECGRSFVFHSDVELHKKQFDHSMLMLYNLQNNGKGPFTRGRMSLSFRLKDRPSQIIVEYEYYPSIDKINYINVHYTNADLRSKVERDPAMMKNIDNYLRRTLKKKLPVGLSR